MNFTIRYGSIVVLLVLSAACESSRSPRSASPTAPSPPAATASPAPPPVANFPPQSGPSRTFVFDHALSPYGVRSGTETTRFVLWDNGAFARQYGGQYGSGENRGGYTNTNGVLDFMWEAWSAAGPFHATGTLNGNLLTIQYNTVMQLSDYEDAVYTEIR